MLKKILFFTLISFLSISNNIASAGQVTGTVKEIIVRAEDGLHYFYMNGTATDKPACATNSYWMIKDENSAAGKAQFSMLLTAYVTGKIIKVTGSNSCTRWRDGEDASVILFIEVK